MMKKRGGFKRGETPTGQARRHTDAMAESFKRGKDAVGARDMSEAELKKIATKPVREVDPARVAARGRKKVLNKVRDFFSDKKDQPKRPSSPSFDRSIYDGKDED